MTMMFLNYWWCFTIICHTNWLWGKLHHVSCTFTVCFSRLVWMLSSCNCFCLFSLDSRSWWTCSSFTFCRTRPDSPTVQSSSAQLISLCLGLPGSESRKNPFSVCLHYKTLWRKYFLHILRELLRGWVGWLWICIYERTCQLTCPIPAPQIQNQTVPGGMGVGYWSQEAGSTHSLKQRGSTGLLS